MDSAFLNRSSSDLWVDISPCSGLSESALLQQLLPIACPSEQEKTTITDTAYQLIKRVRADKKAIHMIDALLLEYSLDSKEGVLLMCLAEALMRIPDADTADALIKDKLSVADWKSHLKNSDSIFVNASTWGLLLTGKVVNLDNKKESNSSNVINSFVQKMSEPIIRQAMNKAMKIMAYQFVLGQNINEAQKNGRTYIAKGFSYSYDMLGETALTLQDSEKYFQAYMNAIESIKHNCNKNSATVSIKLSALHPRYEVANKERVLTELYQSVLRLIKRARSLDVGLTIDAEEADRLELSLMLFEKLYLSEETRGWGNFGLVVQAYGKRALPVLAWLAKLAKTQGDCIPVRLVKGAYWDSELKLSQEHGHDSYPVFTRKEATDVAYLACARFLLQPYIKGLIYPQFATHNAHTVASVVAIATHKSFEFQCLHGMGGALYQHAVDMFSIHVRIYAPVGSHQDLLPYLVRRLLENGANSSFVHRLVDAKCSIESLIQHPIDALIGKPTLFNGLIPLPSEIFTDRNNSSSVNLNIESEAQPFLQAVHEKMDQQWLATPIINGLTLDKKQTASVFSPYDKRICIGENIFANEQQLESALSHASNFYPQWSKTTIKSRAQYFYQWALLLEKNMPELVALCHQEAGKTIQDSIDEVREAIDFCRYYALQAEQQFTGHKTVIGYDQISRQLAYQGRGVFVCISPWNFPLAIFVGQISAALLSGNTVIAKPAEQTSLIAMKAIQLLLETGIPAQSIHLLPGTGKDVGAALVADHRVSGVVFTGSTVSAQSINRILVNRKIKPATLIAETGGQNAMIVDSTALPEQVVRDVLRSAFSGAGQRCSALRVLFIQDDVADRIIELIKGAMSELSIGLPYLYQTDIGPVIDQVAKSRLLAHIKNISKENKLLEQVALPSHCENGYFVAPTAVEIKHMSQLESEHFGPILHIIRYPAKQLDKVINQINESGFGLTMGIHSRNETTYRFIEKSVQVGNCYINRDQVGAVVGVQPFGGQGLSGTGPKAGGPNYLLRFCTLQLA